MIKKVAILGAGSFGKALAYVCAKKIKEINLWSRENSIEEALKDAQLIILTVPMKALGEVLFKIKPYCTNGMIVINASKGIDSLSLKLPVNLINEILGKETAKKSCYLSGPSFAHEIKLNLPTAITLASEDKISAQKVQNFLSSFYFRVYISNDVVGVCLGGALKNVIAIASGLCEGLSLGKNAQAALITRGLHEIVELGLKMGAKEHTFLGLSGVGDLMLSCHDATSRNFRLGLKLSQGLTLDEALAEIGTVVEGVNTAKSISELCSQFGISMPICTAVHEVLFSGIPLKEAMNALLTRPIRDEDFN